MQSTLREYFESLVVTVILALFGTTFVVQAFKIPTPSMEDNLLVGDHLLVNKFLFSKPDSLIGRVLPFSEIKHGDIIVFKYPEDLTKNYVKRAIGLPGDHLRVENQTVFLNGKALEEPYTFHKEPDVRNRPVRDNFPMLAEQINQIIQAVNKLGLAVRGLYGEGTEALGNVFQVSNQMTLGESESAIVERLEKVLAQIIEHEENARATLFEKKPKMVYNHIGRAYGILANAHSISSKETMNLLSLMRLGMDVGLFPGVDRSLADELFILTQPAHLQKQHSEKLSAEERDLLRADMVRERLRSVSRPVGKPPPVTPGNGLDKPQN
jgi:signal peptidase I